MVLKYFYLFNIESEQVRNMKTVISLPTLLLSSFALLAGCSTAEDSVADADSSSSEGENDEDTSADETTSEAGDLVELAQGDPRFSTLVAALGEAELVDALRGEGPMTVFAPTNDAFAKLPPDVLDAILADKARLSRLLLHHVVAGSIASEQLADHAYVDSLAGQPLFFSTEGGAKVSGVDVTQADIGASNGILHVVDEVILVPEASLAQIVETQSEFSTLRAALAAADLTDALNGDGPLTVFAPTNSAFEALPEGTLDQLLANEDALRAVLTYHVVAARALSPDLVDGQQIETLNSAKIAIDLKQGVKINDSSVTTADVLATNGVVHVIDKVLLPPDLDLGSNKSIVDIALADPNFSTLVSALQAAELVDTLSGEGPFTVLAPTNDAFDALPEGVLDALLADKEQLKHVLLHHVIDGEAFSKDVASLSHVTSLAGQAIAIAPGSSLEIGGAMVIQADVDASNGVLHAIDHMIVPPSQNIVEFAVANDNFSTLVTAVQTADLAETLAGPGPFTLFAPTNAAFDALPAGTLDGLLADKAALTSVLLYHVVGAAVYAGDLVDGESLASLEPNQSLEIDLSNGVRVANGNVSTANQVVTNGVIHVVDSVLLAP
jgi:transforming growth factor-beta-induced protein